MVFDMKRCFFFFPTVSFIIEFDHQDQIWYHPSLGKTPELKYKYNLWLKLAKLKIDPDYSRMPAHYICNEMCI